MNNTKYFLNEPYDKSAFLDFLRDEFLPNDFQDEPEDITPPPGTDRIRHIEKVGRVPSLDDLMVYEIHHQSENDPRVSLTRETFSLMKRFSIKYALAIYVSSNSDNYRFSFVRSGFTVTDKGQAKREFSNPRRFSFFLGPDAKVKTPEMSLRPKGRKKGRICDIQDLKDRFDIQVLTKSFYKELSNWYFWALRNTEFPKDVREEENGRNIAVIRLITRLVFIWFMKQKGLVHEHLFDLDNIKSILISVDAEESTYYKAILQNLFFATLNTPPGKRRFRKKVTGYKGYNPDFGKNDIYRYKKYFQEPEKILENFKGIPFLNGGLFKCLDKKKQKPRMYIDGFSRTKKYQLKVPNFLFFSDRREVDLNKEYGTKNEKYEVRRLINILNDYNFTIDENTPIDQEVSLDPELLGQIFENLLASYNPETATTARKATGSYYTPRPIVEFMVDESLKQYFLEKLEKTDEDKEVLKEKINSLLSYHQKEHEFNEEQVSILIQAIEELKVIDPVVGSGAFPMGILQKMVLVLNKLDPNNEKLKQEKIRNVEENFFDPTLKEKLILNIENYFETNRPDYSRKLHLIERCIHGVDIQPIAIQIAKLRFFISLLVDEKVEEDKENMGVEPLPNLETKFVAANSLIGLEDNSDQMFKVPEVVELEKELRKVRADYFNASLPEEKEKVRKQDKKFREGLLQELGESDFDDKFLEQMAGWNPYDTNSASNFFDPEWMFGVKEFDIVIANPPYMKERDNKETFAEIINSPLGRKHHQGKMDYWYFFLHLAIDLVRDKGLIAYITSRYWLKSAGASKLIKRIKENLSFVTVLDIGKLKVFDNVAGQHMVAVYTKGKKYRSFIYKKVSKNLENINVNESLDNIEIKKLDNSNVILDTNEVLFKKSLLSFEGSVKLGEKYNVSQGVVEGPAEVSIKKARKFNYKAGRGVFVISNDRLSDLKLSRSEKKFVKKYLDTNNVGKYHIKFEERYLLYLTKTNCSDIKKYPNLEGHLREYKKIMEQRRETKNGSNKWFHLHWPRKDSYFESPKIIFKEMFDKPEFTYDNDNYYVGMSFLVINQKSKEYCLKFLLGILNSKLANNWFYKFGKKRGVGVDIGVTKLRAFPFRHITSQNKHLAGRIETLVDKILKKKEKNPDADTTDLETEIDQLVYKLYNLTPEEIEIVEKKKKYENL